jgi:phospholipid transport system substrate-binding protein
MIRRLAFPRAIGVALLVFAPIFAAPRIADAQDAAAFIRNVGTQAIEVMGPSVSPGARTARFRHLFENDFDLPGAARFVLGPHGRDLTPQQQQEFLTLFREALAQAYSQKLGQYGGQPFRVTGSRPMGGETIVSSQVDRAGGAPIEIDWHVADRGGRLLITDVAIDGVSQKVAQRNQYAAIIQRNGGRPDALLAALRQELAQAAPPMTGSSSPPRGSVR